MLIGGVLVGAFFAWLLVGAVNSILHPPRPLPAADKMFSGASISGDILAGRGGPDFRQITFQEHEYLYTHADKGICLLHSESCPCKNHTNSNAAPLEK